RCWAGTAPRRVSRWPVSAPGRRVVRRSRLRTGWCCRSLVVSRVEFFVVTPDDLSGDPPLEALRTSAACLRRRTQGPAVRISTRGGTHQAVPGPATMSQADRHCDAAPDVAIVPC